MASIHREQPPMRSTSLIPLLSLHLLLLFTPLTAGNTASREPVGQNLIVLLIDGYGAGLFNRTNSKLQNGIRTLLEQGVQAEAMRPVFPTQSYPNWESLATGLYVENHNFTSDFLYDEERDLLFQRDLGANDTDPKWWADHPAPVWYTVGKAHIDVHCYWFATCHRAHVDMIVQVPHSRRHSFKVEGERDLFSHLPRIMRHLKKYQSYRQQLVLLRLDGLGKALRQFGEETDPVVQALSNVDAHVRKLQDELEAHGLLSSTNLVVLSDHGLHPIEEEDKFYLEECLSDYARVKQVVNSLSFTMIYPAEGEEDTVFFELKVCEQWAPAGDYDEESDDVPLVTVYRRHELPDQWHWKNARFIAPIVLVTRPGVILLTNKLPSTDVSEAMGKELKMIGGWDNESPDMQAIFMARGPAFKVDYKGGTINTVDVYQLLLNILGVQPEHPHNGTFSNVEEFLSDGWEERAESSHACPILFSSLLPSVFHSLIYSIVLAAIPILL